MEKYNLFEELIRKAREKSADELSSAIYDNVVERAYEVMRANLGRDLTDEERRRSRLALIVTGRQHFVSSLSVIAQLQRQDFCPDMSVKQIGRVVHDHVRDALSTEANAMGLFG